METATLNNGLKILYEKRSGSLTSFCIGFQAGAEAEMGFNLGTAHALEHMLFKGTKSRKENEINNEIDSIFGFSNAMTNYPYTIYYGTCRSTDFPSAAELYSDIIMNPLLKDSDFQEERKVILQELKDWREDVDQQCEDVLFYNAFNNKRIKELIIGTEDSIGRITVEELIKFYNRFYNPDNCVISIVSSLPFTDAASIIKNLFEPWEKRYECSENGSIKDSEDSDIIKSGTYIKEENGLQGSRIKYIFDISMLNEEEVYALNIFNEYFGNGVSSLLYDEVRTKGSMAYEVFSSVKAEKGIELFCISLNTSIENCKRAIETVDSLIKNIAESKELNITIEKYKGRYSLKKALEIERTIVLANRLVTYEIMYGDSERLYKEINGSYNTDKDMVSKTVKRILKSPAIQILMSGMSGARHLTSDKIIVECEEDA